jgi:hypothetical protein
VQVLNTQSSSRCAEESNQERELIQIGLIARGEIPFPSDLSRSDQHRWIPQVRALRRQHLLEFLARLVANRILARRACEEKVHDSRSL